MSDPVPREPGIDPRVFGLVAAAAAILMITMGMRQSLGLFIAPIIDSTHVGYAAMSFAMAVGQLMWGVSQPAFGALADRFGPWRVLLTGALIIAVYLAAPKTAFTFYVLAAALGFTWLATVPPTAGLIGKLFGVRYLATLFGLATFTHQVGAFFGAWLGGLALVRFGDYSWMWYADMALATLAAMVNLPIREAKPQPAVAPA
jgi:MFS family permease